MGTQTVGPIRPGLSDAKRALLARRLKGVAGAEPSAEMIRPRVTGAKIPISVDQYRIWLHHFLQPEVPTYNEPVTIFHEGPLDAAILKKSLEYYAGRHEAWRTSFQMENGEVSQVMQPSLDVPVSFVDLSGFPEAERDAEDLRLATEQAVQPFDLTKAPLFRVLLTRMSPTQDRVHFVVHHIAFDGTAMRDSLVPELAAIYAALADGKEPILPALGLHAHRGVAYIVHSLDERAMDFWREELAGDLEVLRLPMDRSRPALISQRGSMERFTLSGELTEAIREVSRKHGATLYMTLLATLQVLLFRYSGQEDVILGTASNGRRQTELQGMMGYILDTFPVRSKPKADRTFSAFLAEVRSSLLGALGAAEVPFDRIVQATGLKRDPSYHPFFQTFFSFLPPMRESPKGWDLQPKMVDTGCAKFDLYVEAEEHEEGLAACILYNTDLFDAATIRRMTGHWTTLLESVCANSDTALGELPLLTQDERDTMLVQWNATEAAVPATTMHELVSEQVRRTPDAIAVEFERTRLTYAQLEDRAERFAVLLRDAGAGPGKLVAICIDRSENLLAGLLGILKTGATYLPLDPGTPLARITLCLEDAAPAVLLTQQGLVSQLPVDGATVLTIEELVIAAEKLPQGSKVPAHVVGPEDSAYVIHTSGSTGRPKAVELPHGAVVNLLLSMQREPGLKATDVLVAVTTISFDIAVLELFMPIITGARVVIAKRTTALDPFELSDLIEESGCTVIQATPATWRALMAIDWPGKKGLKVLCGGEALTRDLAEKLLALKLEVWNVYGPTETTIWSTTDRVRHRENGGVPIGRPIANTTTYILDAQQQPVPVGVAGELYIGGMGLAKGYRGQPELTAEKFVWPAVAEGARVYRTGDYAVYRTDGTIECQGRADNQVKVRGYRIELEEVELHLSAHPQVASAAARVWKDEAVGNRLAGYIVGKMGATPDARELRKFLQQRLPEYMIPSDFVLLDVMPLTANGKTDRKALLPPGEKVSLQQDAAADGPLTEVEERLAKIWCETLGVKSVGKHDNFFDLGGHSLLLVVMFGRLNKEFASSLPITSIFDAQTLSALAKVLTEGGRISSLVPVKTAGTKAPLFMAHSYLLYHGLSKTLGDDQPFYGLRELDDHGTLSIVERAQRYIADMKQVQPRGPYRVAGWCAAGPLAVEISRQLLLQGESVGTLLLFDAWLPEYLEEVQRAERSKSYAKAMKGMWERFSAKTHELSAVEKVQHFWRVARQKVKQSRDDFYIRNWSAMREISERLHIPLPQFMHNTTLQTFAAMREFEAEALPVKVTLLRAVESLQIANSAETCGWERVAQNGVDVLWAPGDHETMFRGMNLQVTSKLIQGALDSALD